MKHRHPWFLTVVCLVATGCAAPTHRAEFTSGYPTYDCPESLDGRVTLQAEALPIDLQTERFKQTSVETHGAVGRRLQIFVTPDGSQPSNRIVWSSLSVTTYGGTLLGWDRLDIPAARARDEISTVEFSSGQMKLRRIARNDADLAGRHTIDVAVMPGGIAVDDTVVRQSALWREDGTPLPADDIALQLISVRHPPGLDVVEASVELTYVVRVAGTRDERVCTAQTRLTLVDREALRPAFWDVGLGSPNAARKQRLALFDPALGAVRLLFESAASAHSFATWLKATRATQVGTYPLRVFDQPGRWDTRPLGPVSDALVSSLRQLTGNDIDEVGVGMAGDP